MRKTLLLLAWIGIGCGATAHKARAGVAFSSAFSREVTAIGMFTHDLPTRYQRLHDTPGRMFVLWSSERLCIVDEKIWIRTTVGDRIECEWRSPR